MHVDVPKVIREESSNPFINCGCLLLLQSPLHFTVITHSLLTAFITARMKGGRTIATPPSLCS